MELAGKCLGLLGKTMMRCELLSYKDFQFTLQNCHAQYFHHEYITNCSIF